MISINASDIIESIVEPEMMVIDIGGGRNPYYRADYVLDIREFEEKKGYIAYGRGKSPEKFSKKTWISQNFYDLPWPFDDNYFDFSLCMGTLEDLRDPLPVIKEIQRISKAGYISTPTRAKESCPYIVNRHSKEHGLVGYFHHRWVVEVSENKLVFKAKNPLIYKNKKFQIKDVQQQTLNFFWHNSFKAEEKYYGPVDDAWSDLQKFKKKHTYWVENIRKGEWDPTFYNYWNSSLGPEPDFSKFVNSSDTSILRYQLNRLIQVAKKIINKG